MIQQALTAMIVGDQEAVVGPEKDYVVYPSKEDIMNKKGILHHYVDVSKEWIQNCLGSNLFNTCFGILAVNRITNIATF